MSASAFKQANREQKRRCVCRVCVCYVWVWTCLCVFALQYVNIYLVICSFVNNQFYRILLLNFSSNWLSRYNAVSIYNADLQCSLDLLAVSRSPAWLKSLSQAADAGMAVFLETNSWLLERSVTDPYLQLMNMKGTSPALLSLSGLFSWMRRSPLHLKGCCSRGHHFPRWSPVGLLCSLVLCRDRFTHFTCIILHFTIYFLYFIHTTSPDLITYYTVTHH